jgi:hypothetical protein
MTTPERDDEADELPEVVDPINAAICPLIMAVFEMTADGSPERAAAMNEVLAAAEKVRAALHKRALN